MPNAEYRKGYRAELELVLKAKALGLWARRVPGSRGPYDVIIVRDDHQWLVDVKVNNWAPPASRIALAPFNSQFTTCVLAQRVSPPGKWLYRVLGRDAALNEISDVAPWSSFPS